MSGVVEHERRMYCFSGSVSSLCRYCNLLAHAACVNSDSCARVKSSSLSGREKPRLTDTLRGTLLRPELAGSGQVAGCWSAHSPVAGPSQAHWTQHSATDALKTMDGTLDDSHVLSLSVSAIYASHLCLLLS